MRTLRSFLTPVLVLLFFLLSTFYAAPYPDDQLILSNAKNGLWSDKKEIEIKNELIIGKEYSTEADMFSYIRDIAFDQQDNLYVVDSMELCVKIFDKNGAFVCTFGGEGQGPGEFQTIDAVCWSRIDNFLYIADRSNQRISWFSADGLFKGSEKTDKFKATIEGICCLDDGRFVLTARFAGDRISKYKIYVTSHNLKNVIAEIEEKFPIYAVGATVSPKFSDVGTLQGERIYYTSPSEYKIFVLDFQKQMTIEKSHPRMFEPNYVGGFYIDFNTIETLMSIEDRYIVGVQSTLIKEIPRFKEKRELIEFVYMPDLREMRLKTVYQLDFYNKDFQFLGKFDIPEKMRLAGKDSQDRVYFIENDPFPRIIRTQILIKDKT